jgi:hypothetical protein
MLPQYRRIRRKRSLLRIDSSEVKQYATAL